MDDQRPVWWHRVEAPTWLVATAIYAGFGLLTWHWTMLPGWLVLPAGAWLVAWHASLQHECLHGHPTRRPWINRLVAGPSLWLWLPYDLYRTEHTRHHRAPRLTDPTCDPESFYVDAAAWRRMPPWQRRLLVAHNTLAGRLLLGPPWLLLRFAAGLARQRVAWRAWTWHGLGLTVLFGWLWLCRVPAGEYLLLAAWPGLALTLVRSFHEHRAAQGGGDTVTVERAGPLALLFLNNHRHAAHHAQPSAPWYTLRPEGGYRVASYAQLARAYAFRPKDLPAYPVVPRGRQIDSRVIASAGAAAADWSMIEGG